VQSRTDTRYRELIQVHPDSNHYGFGQQTKRSLSHWCNGCVPARKAESGCIFLTADGRCGIHAVAPFGCAYFDHYQIRSEADRRSLRGLEAVAAAWGEEAMYAQVWLALDGAGLNAPEPEQCRVQMRNSLRKPRP
jgi:hypothetical protein